MPLTLPTHPLPVLALKVWRPRWFDGVALVLGSVAPDVVFATDGYGVAIPGHAWHSALWWALPFALIGTPVVRWASSFIAAHLPSGGPLRLRDYGVLATVRHSWPVTAISALLGGFSHVAWDSVTHATIDNGRIPFPALHSEAIPGRPWWDVLSDLSNLIGLAAGAALAVYVGRSRLLYRWHGAAPTTARRPTSFWAAAGAVFAAGAIALPFQPFAGVFPTQSIRVMLLTGTALVAGAVAVALTTTRSRAATGGGP